MAGLTSSPSASSISSWLLEGQESQEQAAGSDVDSWENVSSYWPGALDGASQEDLGFIPVMMPSDAVNTLMVQPGEAPVDPRQICERVLRSLELDDDIISFVFRGVLDEGCLLPLSDFQEFVLPVLEDACSGNEAHAALLTRTLHGSLAQVFSTASTCGDSHALPMEQTAVTLCSLAYATDSNDVLEGRIHAKLGGRTPKIGHQPRSTRTGCGRASARKIQEMRRKAETLKMESAYLEAQMIAAREKAMMLRGSRGCGFFKQAVKIGPFDLPHPGGLGNLLEDASLTLTPGHRYALLGHNGKGKSTLLRHLAARRDGGLHPAIRVHYVSQDVSFSADTMNLTPVEVVLEADVERRILLDKVQSLESASRVDNAKELQRCLGQLSAIEADAAPSRAKCLLASLGFSEAMLNQKMQALSGGWRVRVGLAAAVFAKPDMLFLDEPTNHLSMQAVLWLMHELTTSPTWSSRVVIMVSHDRFFIDETCTDMLHICGKARRLTQAQCNYTTWARFRAEQQRSCERRCEARRMQIARCKSYIASGAAACGNTANSSRRIQIQKLEKEAEEEADELSALQEDQHHPLRIAAGGILDEAAVRFDNVSFAYPGAEPLFCGVGKPSCEFNVDSRCRIVLVGENGNGKTTLLKLLLGQLQPTEGEVVINRHARFAVINQHHADQIDLARSPFEFIKDKVPGNGSDLWHHYLREELIRNGIDESLLDVPAAALSGGLRSRLAMIAVSVMKPHVLFMDEPTNNLDAGGVNALSDAVQSFEGGVVIVSHDNYFVSQVANEVWSLDGRQVKPFECGFEEYLAMLLCRINPGSSAAMDAVSAYAKKKRMTARYISGGQASREALAKELSKLRGLCDMQGGAARHS
eukprot:CAMPEP_0172807520 /NCGR_PEP_ID=MMETSP1075-20121228/7058_1 /TAXON_ID=2916 /ORGANISM="Ceratium fusus, Strain PA161109" /LENGTH=867 /DNA_ID=CAMNT_0013646519 /DNA_START=75 /DNA_END=2678 /DNA_ORIENTATION=-